MEYQKDLGYQGYHIKENDTLNNSSLKNTSQGSGDDTLNTKTPLTNMEQTVGYGANGGVRSKRWGTEQTVGYGANGGVWSLWSKP